MAITAANLQVRVGADTGPAQRELNSFSRQLQGAARSMAVAGGALSLGITAPLAAVATQALRSAASFEKTFNVMAEVTRAPAQAMAQLEQQALELGASTVFSAGEAADAMLELAKAGFTTQQIGDSIAGVMALAAAGEMDLAAAAQITTGALQAFGLAASDSGRVADLLAAAANASNASMSDLSAGLQQGGFAFAAAGQDIDDLVTSLAILSNVGLTGSDAGTALKNMMMRLISPTQEAAQTMKRLGINVYDAQGNMLPLVDIIAVFNEGLEGLTQQQRNAALETILMSDGMKAMIPLLDQGVSGYNDMKRSVNDVGAAQRIANALTKGLSGAIEELSGAVESFLIGAGKPYLDTLAQWIRRIAEAVTAFGKLPKPVRDAAIALAAVAAAAGPVLGILAGVAGAFALLGPAALPLAALTAGVGLLAAAVASDFGGIRTTIENDVLPPLRDLRDVLTGVTDIPAGMITIGPIDVAWEPNIAKVGIGDILDTEVYWTPKLKTLSINDVITGVWSPQIKVIDIGTVITGTWEPEFKRLQISDILDTEVYWTPKIKTVDINGVITGAWTPKLKAISVGDAITGTWEPNVQRLAIGDVLDVTTVWQPNVKTLEVNDVLVGAWTPEITVVQADGIVEGQWEPEYKRIRIADLIEGVWTPDFKAIDIAGLFRAQIGADGLKITLGPNDFDLTAAAEQVKGQLTLLATAITSPLAGFENMTGPQRFAAIVQTVSNALSALSLIEWAAIGMAGPMLTDLATNVVNFANTLLSGLDVTAITGALTKTATTISEGIAAAISPERLGELGTSIGELAGTITGKITELLSDQKFANDLGAAFGNATAAIAAGAVSLAAGLAAELGKVDWNKFMTSIVGFIDGFLQGFSAGIKEFDASPVGQAIMEKISSELKTAIAEYELLNWLFLGGPPPTFNELMFGGDDSIKRDPGLLQFNKTGNPYLSDDAIARMEQFEWPEIPNPGDDFWPEIKTPKWVSNLGETLSGAWNTLMNGSDVGRGGMRGGRVPSIFEMGSDFLESWGIGGGDEMKIQVVPVIAPDALKGMEPITIPVRPGWDLLTEPGTGEPQVWKVKPVAEGPLEPPAITPEINVKARVTEAEPAAGLQMDFWNGAGLQGAIDEAKAGMQLQAPDFQWPELPQWTWPALPVFAWPALPIWVWPAIPRPGWLSEMVVQRPSWLGELLTWSPVVTVRGGGAPTVPGQLAKGTDYWRGGLTWVGEEGPELVNLPRGTGVRSHRDSMAYMREMMDHYGDDGGAAGTVVQITGPVYVRSEQDLNELAYKVTKIQERQGRR